MKLVIHIYILSTDLHSRCVDSKIITSHCTGTRNLLLFLITKIMRPFPCKVSNLLRPHVVDALHVIFLAHGNRREFGVPINVGCLHDETNSVVLEGVPWGQHKIRRSVPWQKAAHQPKYSAKQMIRFEWEAKNRVIRNLISAGDDCGTTFQSSGALPGQRTATREKKYCLRNHGKFGKGRSPPVSGKPLSSFFLSNG